MHELISLLTTARRRWFVIRVSHILLASAGSALAALIIAVVVAKWFVSADIGSRQVLLVIGTVSALSAALGMALARRSAPSIVTLARAADRKYGLNERLGTAIEVEIGPIEPGLVAQALLEDAANRGRVVDPKRLVRMSWPRWVMSVPALAAALAVASALPVPATPAAAGSPGRSATPIDMAEATSTVQRVAELLARDPDAERDPYLRAVTEALADLGQQLADGSLTQAEMERDVGRLLTQLAQALGNRQDPLAQLVNELTHATVSSTEEAGPKPEAVTAWADEATDREPAPEEADALAAASDSSVGALERLRTELERIEQEEESAASGQPRARGDALDASVTSDDYSMTEEGEPGAAARQDGERAGAPIGAAEEADDGAGDAAGDGLQAASEEAAGERAMRDFELAEDEVALPSNESEDGRKVGIDLVPRAETGATGLDGGGDTMRQHRSEESAATHEVVGAAYRDAVSRYFMPTTVAGALEVP